MITYLYSLLMHHVYVYYTCLLAQLPDHATFGVTSDNILTLTQQAEAVKETPQGLTEWTPDDVTLTLAMQTSSCFWG